MKDDSPSWIEPSQLAALAGTADQADREPAWPEASWRLVREVGAQGWAIPTELGGRGLDRVAQLEGSEQLASACLTTAFLFSQREAAVRWLLGATGKVRQLWLPALARGERFVTVGLSQLTTSGQHRPPSLRASPAGSGSSPAYRLDGDIPWVTGAARAGGIVTGAVLEDGRQLVLLLPTAQPGVAIRPPPLLAALAGSGTASVRCDGAVVPGELVLAGPGQQLVRSGGGLDTSCLALGLARAAIAFLRTECTRRPEVQGPAERLAGALRASRERLHALARSSPPAEAVLALRVECTRLVLRATQAALAVAKGAGFVAGHPAERWARQGHFFLVWSCPQPVALALLADLTMLEPPRA
jgi:alkylation response protein AidB-like acyl-CoA dehydrogenase